MSTKEKILRKSLIMLLFISLFKILTLIFNLIRGHKKAFVNHASLVWHETTEICSFDIKTNIDIQIFYIHQ